MSAGTAGSPGQVGTAGTALPGTPGAASPADTHGAVSAGLCVEWDSDLSATEMCLCLTLLVMAAGVLIIQIKLFFVPN